MSDQGEALRAKYGKPIPIANHVDGVLAWRHPSEESARAFAEANGQEGSVRCEDGVWLSVVDLRPRLAAINEAFRATYRTA